MLLITVSNLKSYLEKTDSTNDFILGVITKGVSTSIQKYLNRFLEKTEYTEYFEVDNVRKRFYLKAYPIDLTADFTVTLDDDEQTIDDDYFVREEAGLITFDIPPIYTEPKGLKVVYTGGYEEIDDSSIDDGTLNVPDDIRMAAYMQAAYMFRRRNDLGISALSLPDGKIEKKAKAGRLIPEVISLLKDYRRSSGAY